MASVAWMSRAIVTATLIATALPTSLANQEQSPRFGGSYSALDARQQRLVDDWVARFNEVTGQKFEPAPFYDDVVRVSTKTTFQAIAHALMTTALTDAAGKPLGDALDLIERVDGVKGKVLATFSGHPINLRQRHPRTPAVRFATL